VQKEHLIIPTWSCHPLYPKPPSHDAIPRLWMSLLPLVL